MSGWYFRVALCAVLAAALAVGNTIYCMTSHGGLGDAPEPQHAAVHDAVDKHVWLIRPSINGICTGFYIGDGLIVTAAHCFAEDDDGLATIERPGMVAMAVDDANEPKLAMVAAISARSDLALLLTTLSGPGLELADVPDTRDTLYAVGVPGDLGTGVVVQPVKIHGYGYENNWYYAHSVGADIWPGMSGGPLLRADGRVFGVITYTRTLERDGFRRDIAGYSIMIKQWAEEQVILGLGGLVPR